MFVFIGKNQEIFIVYTAKSGINKVENCNYFKEGLYKAINLLKPHTIVIYGSDNYDLLDKIREQGINIVAFPSKTSLAFMKEGN